MEIRLIPPKDDLVFNNVLRGFASEGFLSPHTRLIYSKIEESYHTTLAKLARNERTEASQPSIQNQKTKHEYFKKS